MEKKFYSQPKAKVVTVSVNEAVCDPKPPIIQTSGTSGPAHDAPLF